jgi:hypothetical protein
MGLQPVRDLLAEAWRRWCLFYYGAALAQIDPLHDDVPAIVHTLNHLRSLR